MSNNHNSDALTLANITWLLAAMAIVIAPQFSRLPIWMIAACIAVSAWRYWIARRGLASPRSWMMALSFVATAAATLAEYRRVSVRDGWVTLFIILLCLKILEMRSKRDALLVIFLSFVVMITNFLYSQSIFMGGYMVLCVWIFIATLIGFNRVHSNASIRERMIPAGWLLLQAVPIMLVVFFLFPRATGPLWAMPSDNAATSGLTDSMAPGDISKLSLNDAPAFRVEFDGAIPEPYDLYWRGPVLSGYDGRRWSINYTPELRKLNYEPQGAAVSYRVTLQPSNTTWLFALDLPVSAAEDSFFTSDFQMRTRYPVTGLRAYDMQSHLHYKIETELSPVQQKRYLYFPPKINPRTIAYGKKMRDENADSKVIIEKLLALYNKDFDYTLEPPPLGENAMDEFLFDTRQGFCEHYAGSFALLMRAAGIPARVVTGYQGGDTNPISHQLIVKQSDAHAWTEVWLPEIGWLRVDPTSAVSPLRINRGMTAALGPIGVFNNIIAADKLGILLELRYSWDAINTQWNRWVVGFNADKQRDFLSNLGMEDVDWRSIAVWLIASIFFIGAAGGALLIAKLYTVRLPPLVATWNRFCEKLAKRGLTRADFEGPGDFQLRIARERPALAAQTAPIIERYVALRYRNISSAQWQQGLRDFKRSVAALKV